MTLTKQEREAQKYDILQRLILGEVVELQHAAWDSHTLVLGDFAQKRSIRRGAWLYEWWVWPGPGRIRVGGVIMNPGDETKPSEKLLR